MQWRMNARMHIAMWVDARSQIAQNMCWFFCYLPQTVISILVPSKVFMFFWHQPRILALKSPNTTTENGLLLTICSKLKIINEILKFIFCLARISRETYEIACFVTNFNPKLNTFLTTWYVYDLWYRYTPLRFVFEGWTILTKL